MAGSKEWGEENQVEKLSDALARCLPLARFSQLGVINETKFSSFSCHVLLGCPAWQRLWSGFLLFSQLKCSSSDEEGGSGYITSAVFSSICTSSASLLPLVLQVQFSCLHHPVALQETDPR